MSDTPKSLPRPHFDAIDRTSVVWKRIREFYDARLEMLRRMNDGRLDEMETARLRGRIAECKTILSFDSDKPEIGAEDQLFKD